MRLLLSQPAFVTAAAAFDCVADILSNIRATQIISLMHRAAFSMNDVLLLGSRANAQNPNGFVVVGDALSDELCAIMLRKDDTSLKPPVDRHMGRADKPGIRSITYRFMSQFG